MTGKKKKRKLSGFINNFGKTEIVAETEVQKVEPAKVEPKTEKVLHESVTQRFGANGHLLFDLDAAFQVFDVSNDAANQFFLELVERSEIDSANNARLLINGEHIIFNQPSLLAYKTELEICSNIQSGEIRVKTFNEFIETHTVGVPLDEWVSSKDVPLWQVRIFDGEKEIEASVCNSVQSAIMCGFWSAKNPDVRHEIKET